MSKEAPSSPRGFVDRIVESIFPRPIVPRSDADRRRTVLEFLVLHMRPVRLPEKSLRYTHTWGLGGMSLVLLFLLAATGLLLMLVYEPVPERAYESIISLQQDVLFGGLVRNLHHWSANLLVAIALLHLLRVFFTGGYFGPRRFNWVIGLSLLLAILASNFTGYLLPWDQLAYWAVTICTGMLAYVPWIGDWLQSVARGGSDIGPSTLIIFYTLHTSVIPVSLILLAALHFWRVRKARGVVLPRRFGEPREHKPTMVLTLPHLLMRELAVALTLLAVVMLMATFMNPPLDAAANAGMSPNPAKAPWYFMGFQELQLHFHPLFAVVFIPLLAAAALMLLPYQNTAETGAGIWFVSPVGRRTAALAAGLAAILTPAIVVIDELWLQPGSGVATTFGRGIVPTVVIAALVCALIFTLRRKMGSTREETTQAVFVLFGVSFAMLTIIGVWFRGPGMALGWWP